MNNIETQTNQPQICEQTRKNLWNRIADARKIQRAEMRSNIESISERLHQIKENDGKQSNFSRFNLGEVVFQK